MNPHALLTLQQVDSQLDHLAGERRRLPERAALATATAQQAAWTAEDTRLRALVDGATRDIAEAEREGAALDAKKTRLEAQLRTVTTERQADALAHEIATIDQHHSELDDRELAAMEVQSDAEAALQELADRAGAIVAAVDAAQAALDATLAKLAADEAELASRRAEADGALSDEERALYASLRKRFDGVGIVQLEGRRCSGCHLDLSATEADTVHRAPADELPECPHCGRLIVR